MEVVKNSILERIQPLLDKAGMYYRIFARTKSHGSIVKKLTAKGSEYRKKNKKMQDLIGIRVVFYFQDDVLAFYHKLQEIEGYDKNNESFSKKELNELTDLINSWGENIDSEKSKLKRLLPFHDKIFMPERLNLVIRMNDKEAEMTRDFLNGLNDSEIDVSLIDTTFEIQLRTVLSEGWHEVEHDLRYKTQQEDWWNFCTEESRMLNGIYASLETSESSLSMLIDKIAYKNYKNKNWDAMIRFHFRRRMTESKLSDDVCSFLNQHQRIAKKILYIERNELANHLWNIKTGSLVISSDLILFLVNRLYLDSNELRDLEPIAIKIILNKS